MFLVNSAMVDLQIGTAGLVALLGYAVVFVGLIALMVVILIEGKIAVARSGCRRTRYGRRGEALQCPG